MSYDGNSYLDSQSVLRERLIVIIKVTGLSMKESAKNIGIARFTLKSFVSGEDASWKTLCKIEKYIADAKKIPKPRYL